MSNNNLIEAIAVFNNNEKPRGNKKNNIYGTVVFRESSRSNNIIIDIDLKGLTPGKHGFHIHETGNVLDDCKACKGHFNPFGQTHGGLRSQNRHVGDLGNITANQNGECNCQITDNQISLRNLQRNIIGRCLVIHSDEDDLGRGGNEESLITGNAGSRIGCAVIGYKNIVYF